MILRLRRHSIRIALTLSFTLVALFLELCDAIASEKPNIVLLVADDLGWADIGANNPDTFYETPHIDRLAAQGMRFTDAYAACPVCSPTRGSIMTGKYPPRFGITDYIGGHRPGKLLPALYAPHLPLEEVTIAEQLRDAGYATFFAGKWHLGHGDYSPNAQGFGPVLQLGGEKQFFYPQPTAPWPSRTDDPKTTDRIADEAVHFIEKHQNRPFFAYLPFLAVHTPILAREDLVEKYRQKESPPAHTLWGAERANKVRLVQDDPVYAAMLEQMDSAIGRVLSAIETSGLADRTVVIFVSDNGGLSTAEGHPTSNLPLRAGKGWLYEGGIRVPWIVYAPGITEPGSVSDVPVVTCDVYPTLLELAGLPPAPQQHRDGLSLVPLLRDAELLRDEPLFWHYPHYGNQGGAPGGAIRNGDWKLVEWYEDNSVELFNLKEDIGEKHNLVAELPVQAAQLRDKLHAWRKAVGAIMPTPNPEFRINGVSSAGKAGR